MFKQSIALTCLAATSLCGPSAHAFTIINEEFDSVAPPVLPTGWSGDTTSGRTTQTLADTSNLFQSGTDNQFLQFQDATQAANYQGYVALTIDAGDVFTISFLAVEQEATNGDLNNGAFRLADGSLASGSNAAYTFLDGLLAADRGDLFEVYLLINNSLAAKSFDNPVTGLTDTVAAGEARGFIFNRDDLVFSELAGTNGSKSFGDVTRFGYTVSSSNKAQMNIDNVKTVDGLIIPEPASLALIASGGFLVVGGRRNGQAR